MCGDAAELAADHYKTRFDERTSTWKDEELLQPGKKVWLEMRGIDMPADDLMPTVKLRPRYMGPVTIVRRRRHWTFEVDCGGGAEGAPEPQIREILGVVREMPAGAP